MSEWGMYEIDDIAWDGFGDSDDHIVPHPGSEEVDVCIAGGNFQKKPRHEVVGAFTKNAGTKSVAKDAVQGKKETCSATLMDGMAPILEKGSWSCTPDGVFHASCDAVSIKKVTNITSEETKKTGNCFSSSNMDSIGNEFCTDDPILGNRSSAIIGNLCDFPLGDISPTDNDLEFFSNENEDKERNDLLYYGWPDIGNFEDVDRLFRSCDTTFGHGNASIDDGLSWFSSTCHAVEDSEDAPKSGFNSSFLESSEHHEADLKCMPNTVNPLINDSDKGSVTNTYRTKSQASDADAPASASHSSYATCFVSNAENGESTSEEHVNEQQSVTHDSIQVNLHGKQLKYHKPFRQRKNRSLEYLRSDSCGPGTLEQLPNEKLPSSVSPAPQVFPSAGMPQQKKNLRPDSSNYLHTYIHYPLSEKNHPSHQILVKSASSVKSESRGHPSLSSKASSYASNCAHLMENSPEPLVMTPDEKIENLCRKKQVQATLAVDPQHENIVAQASFTDHFAGQKKLHQIQDEVRGYCKVEGIRIDFPVEVDSSTVQGSSCMSSVLSDEISGEATSFLQLQHVMEQLYWFPEIF